MVNAQSLYWFDYETFGISPIWDRPSQFAGQRTDLELNPIGDPMVCYCKPATDYLPDPHACRVTQQQPPDIAQRGLIETEFIQQVVTQLGYPGTCSVGYNSIRFDDEFTRHTLFRNLYDAYAHEWQQTSSRWDLLDVVRLTRALRPDDIQWPENADGSPSNRLQDLTRANGLEHAHAHDAMSDVKATLSVARLIRAVQPRLYDYTFSHRDKQSIAALLNLKDRRPCLLVSGMISSAHGHVAIVTPIARHPTNANGVIVLDLRDDPSELADLSIDAITHRVFCKQNPGGGHNEGKTPAADRPRLKLRTVHINRCPVVVPLETLRDADAERLGIDLAKHRQHQQLLMALCNDDFCDRIRQAMTQSWDSTIDDVDGSLYSGNFLGHADKQQLAAIHTADAEALSSFSGLFEDPRLDEMLFRYRARNYPQTLTAEERMIWNSQVREKLDATRAPWTTWVDFTASMQAIDWQASEQGLKKSLVSYAQKLKSVNAIN